MHKKTKALPVLIALSMAPMAMAQTNTPTTAPDMGAPANGQAKSDAPGTPYIKSTEGDWDIRCVHSKDGHDPCQLYQLLKDETKNPVAEFAITNLPKGQAAAAGATIVTPLETLLPRGITLKIDSQPPKSYSFLYCNRQGCVANVGFTSDELDAMKKGKEISMSIVPVASPDQSVDLKISLNGFTAGFEKVSKSNLANKALPMPPSAGAATEGTKPSMPKVPSLGDKSGN